MNDFLVDINADPYEIALNEKGGLGGRVSFSSEDNSDYNKDFDNIDVPYIMKGMLATSFYMPNITRIETRRYILDDVYVYKTEFGTMNDDIIYHFEANGYRVKYQMAQNPAEYVREVFPDQVRQEEE